MTNISQLIYDIKSEMKTAFDAVDQYFEADSSLREFKPAKGGWNINEVLEHIALTNHFLLILIEKGARKALEATKTSDLENQLQSYNFEITGMTEVGLYAAFQWIRPEHMEPTGSASLTEVRIKLRNQEQTCLATLTDLKNGEGVLYKTTMTVNNLGKLDVYQYIYFLVQHAKRHLQQIQNIENEWLQSQK